MRTTDMHDRLDVIAMERDQRSAPRYSTRDLAIVTIGQATDVPASECFPVQLHDLSPRGARFAGRIPLSRGDQFVLYLPNGNTRIALLATAAFVMRRPDGQMLIGAEFASEIGKEQPADAPAVLEEAELSRIRAVMLGN